jgi:hypothetical protein
MRRRPKLQLSRETLFQLELIDPAKAQGGTLITCTCTCVSRVFACTDIVSVCVGCTGRLDTCPAQETIA